VRGWTSKQFDKKGSFLPHLVGTGGFLFVSISMAHIKVVESKQGEEQIALPVY